MRLSGRGACRGKGTLLKARQDGERPAAGSETPRWWWTALTGAAAAVLLVTLGLRLGPAALSAAVIRWSLGRLLLALDGPACVIVALALVRWSAGLADERLSLRAVDGWLPLRGAWLRTVVCLGLCLLGGVLFLAGVGVCFVVLVALLVPNS